MSQKALLLKQAGSPLELVNDHAIPQPGPHQIQVKVTVAGLNGHDQKIRDMGLFLDRVGLPAVLASDVVGTVLAVGDSVTSFRVGDRVVSQADFVQGTPQNGLQEKAVFHEQYTAKIPANISDDDAATLPTNLVASVMGLFHDLPIPAPWTEEAHEFDYQQTTLLIIGGGSFAGRFAVQLAKLAAIGRIVVVGGKEEELKQYGATHVLDRHGGQEIVLERIRAVVADELIYAYDAVNMPEGQLLPLNALSSHKKGYFARLLPLPVDRSRVVGKEAGFEVRDVLGVSSTQPKLFAKFWTLLPEYLEQGRLLPSRREEYEVSSDFSAENVNAILDAFQKGGRIKHAHVHIS